MRSIIQIAAVLLILVGTGCARVRLTQHSILVEENTPLTNAKGRVSGYLGDQHGMIFWPGQMAPREGTLRVLAEHPEYPPYVDIYSGPHRVGSFLGRFGPVPGTIEHDGGGMTDLIFGLKNGNLYLTGRESWGKRREVRVQRLASPPTIHVKVTYIAVLEDDLWPSLSSNGAALLVAPEGDVRTAVLTRPEYQAWWQNLRYPAVPEIVSADVEGDGTPAALRVYRAEQAEAARQQQLRLGRRGVSAYTRQKEVCLDARSRIWFWVTHPTGAEVPGSPRGRFVGPGVHLTPGLAEDDLLTVTIEATRRIGRHQGVAPFHAPTDSGESVTGAVLIPAECVGMIDVTKVAPGSSVGQAFIVIQRDEVTAHAAKDRTRQRRLNDMPAWRHAASRR